MRYYIKYVYGPEGQNGYPDKGGIHFEKKCYGSAERFSECDGFLLYETEGEVGEGAGRGAKAIYGQGTVSCFGMVISPPEVEEAGGKKFTHFVEIDELDQRINPHMGIPSWKMREMTGIRIRPSRGGLLKITNEQYNILSKELENCAKKVLK